MSICKEVGCNNKSVCKGLCNKHYLRLTRGCRKPLSEYVREDAFLDYTECMAYSLGLLYSDGYILKGYKGRQYQVGLKLNDYEPVEIVASYIGIKHAIKYTDRANGNPFHSFRISSDALYMRLSKLGLTIDKSFNQRVPKLPLSLYKHFLRGLVDGDGHINRLHHTVSIILAGDLAYYILNLLNNYSYTCDLSVVKNKSGFDLYRVSIPTRNNNSLRFLDWIYGDSNYHMLRKYNLYKDIKLLRENITYCTRRGVQENSDIYNSIIDDDIV